MMHYTVISGSKKKMKALLHFRHIMETSHIASSLAEDPSQDCSVASSSMFH